MSDRANKALVAGFLPREHTHDIPGASNKDKSAWALPGLCAQCRDLLIFALEPIQLSQISLSETFNIETYDANLNLFHYEFKPLSDDHESQQCQICRLLVDQLSPRERDRVRNQTQDGTPLIYRAIRGMNPKKSRDGFQPLYIPFYGQIVHEKESLGLYFFPAGSLPLVKHIDRVIANS
jgi:hypothetical protein